MLVCVVKTLSIFTSKGSHLQIDSFVNIKVYSRDSFRLLCFIFFKVCSRSHSLAVEVEFQSLSPSFTYQLHWEKGVWFFRSGMWLIPTILTVLSKHLRMDRKNSHPPVCPVNSRNPHVEIIFKRWSKFGFKNVWSLLLLGYKRMVYSSGWFQRFFTSPSNGLICFKCICCECNWKRDCQNLQGLGNFFPVK